MPDYRYDLGRTLPIAQWTSVQNQLRRRAIVSALPEIPRFVAGADVAFSMDKQQVLAAAVVYDRLEQRVMEVAHARQEAEIPYIPGFLSFREGPALVAAIGKLHHEFGVICFDGQGFAHPRRCGLATHVGVSLDLPSIGVAKSRLTGTYHEPALQVGASSPLMDGPEQLGLVLRTRAKVKPLFISVGHRVDLDSAVAVVMACCTRHRLPEPTRQADIEVAKLKKQLG